MDEKDENECGFIASEGLKMVALATWVMGFYARTCNTLKKAEEKGKTDTEAYLLSEGAKLALERVMQAIENIMGTDDEDEEEEGGEDGSVASA